MNMLDTSAVSKIPKSKEIERILRIQVKHDSYLYTHANIEWLQRYCESFDDAFHRILCILNKEINK